MDIFFFVSIVGILYATVGYINTDEEIHDIWIEAGWESNTGSDIHKIIDEHNKKVLSRLSILIIIDAFALLFSRHLYKVWSK